MNEKPRYTPGPWRVSHSSSYFDGGATVVRDKELVVAVCTWRGEDRSETSPNARLIASAPTLLAALEGAPEPLDDGTEDLMYCHWYHGPRQDAIRRARGED